MTGATPQGLPGEARYRLRSRAAPRALVRSEGECPSIPGLKEEVRGGGHGEDRTIVIDRPVRVPGRGVRCVPGVRGWGQATFSGLEDEDAVEDDEPESDDPDEDPEEEPDDESEDEESEDDEDDSDLPAEAEAPAVDLPEPRLSVR
ncbi:hypothetical protein GCM10023085_12750 [Actinomadura viridis]